MYYYIFETWTIACRFNVAWLFKGTMKWTFSEPRTSMLHCYGIMFQKQDHVSKAEQTFHFNVKICNTNLTTNTPHTNLNLKYDWKWLVPSELISVHIAGPIKAPIFSKDRTTSLNFFFFPLIKDNILKHLINSTFKHF